MTKKKEKPTEAPAIIETEVPAIIEGGALSTDVWSPPPLSSILDEAEDFAVTRIVVASSQGRYYEALGKDGIFIDPDTLDEYGKECSVVVVAVLPKSRTRFAILDNGENDLNSDPPCISTNAAFPTDRQGNLNEECPYHVDFNAAKPCMTCIERTFVDNKKPRCQLGYNYAIVITAIEGEELEKPVCALFRLKGGSIRQAKNLNKQLARQESDHFWNAAFKMMVVRGKNQQGKPYWATQMLLTGPTPEKYREAYMALSKQIYSNLGAAVAKMAEAEETLSDEDFKKVRVAGIARDLDDEDAPF